MQVKQQGAPVTVGIVTATFNSAKTLSRTIESVLAQTVPCLDYTIMDGASTDETVAIANSYAPIFAQKGIAFRVISEPDAGMYDAINKAVMLSGGTIIGNVNSDDYYEPCAVEVVTAEYLKDPFDMLYGDMRIIKPSGDIVKKAKLKKFASTRYWNHPTTFITKATYEKERYKCETMYDDCDLMLRLRKKGYRVHIVNRVLSNFTFGGMSTSKSWKSTKERIRIRSKVYRDNGYGFLYILDGCLVEAAKYILG